MGGLKAKKGAYIMERITSMLATWKKQELSLFSTMKSYL